MYGGGTATGNNYFNSYSSLEPEQAMRINGDGRTLSGFVELHSSCRCKMFLWSIRAPLNWSWCLISMFMALSCNASQKLRFQLRISRETTWEGATAPTVRTTPSTLRPGGGWRTDSLQGTRSDVRSSQKCDHDHRQSIIHGGNIHIRATVLQFTCCKLTFHF